MGFAEPSAAGLCGPSRAMPSNPAPTVGPMRGSTIIRRIDRRPARLSGGAVAAMALAAGGILGPDGGGGAGAAFIALGLLALLAGLRSGSRTPRGRGSGRGGGSGRLGAELMALERRGWLVARSVPTGGNGEIDYLVTAPSTSFLVDVAVPGSAPLVASRLEAQLDWARERYGPDRLLEPILCGSVAPGRVRGARHVPPCELVDYLLDRG